METQVCFLSQGENVCGMLHLPDRAPAAGVVMCHGFTGNKSEAHRLFVTTARNLCAHGLAVLRFDFRGSGDSAGEFRDMTISAEVQDARAAFDFLAARPEVGPRRIGLIGLSMGGCVAACLAGREPRVQALTLWAAVAHPNRIFDRMFPHFGDAEWIDLNGWGLGRAFMEDARRQDPLREVRNFSGPALVVHGMSDQSVPASDAADYQAALGEHARLHYIADADHTFSSFPWTEEAVGHTRQFLLQALEVKA